MLGVHVLNDTFSNFLVYLGVKSRFYFSFMKFVPIVFGLLSIDPRVATRFLLCGDTSNSLKVSGFYTKTLRPTVFFSYLVSFIESSWRKVLPPASDGVAKPVFIVALALKFLLSL